MSLPHPADSDPNPDPDLADAVLTARLSCAFGMAGAITCRRIGPVRALFHRDAGPDTPVGLVSRGAAFLKAGPDSVTRYIAQGMWPYRGNDVRQPLRGYWRVPPDVLEDEPLLADWAARAIDAARQFGRRPARRRAPVTPTLRPKRRKRGKVRQWTDSSDAC